eukprot:TRINITY_DN4840_c0_g1_i1.p1 TRINITY_DN4840_c0_g1~~TRINITY_DN4840_c0_g1_i1.p1  ORF type:complete len:259 (+),score=70.71 TRINITY_DN4840_c0_g1_i1:83-778(+)
MAATMATPQVYAGRYPQQKQQQQQQQFSHSLPYAQQSSPVPQPQQLPQHVQQAAHVGASCAQISAPHVPAMQAPAGFQAPSMQAYSFQPSTAGLPDPEAISKQKDGYIKLLDEQLRQGTATLDMQRLQQTEFLYQQADQQKRQVSMQIDHQVKQAEMQLTQSFNAQLMQVKQQSVGAKTALEQQAMQLTLEYQQKKCQEDMLSKHVQLQREHAEAQSRFAREMDRLQQQSA